MTTIQKYTFADFGRIKDEGFEYTLTPDVMQIIQTIADQVGAPEYVRTPQFVKRDNPVVTLSAIQKKTNQYQQPANTNTNLNSGNNKSHRTSKAAQEITDEDWDTIRRYQTTVLVKRQGVEASIEEIRKLLNKMTQESYDVLKEQILDELDTIQLSKCKNEDLQQIGLAIFTIASGNSFYSQMYATLYKELMGKYSFMQTVFDANFAEVATLFKDFAYVDPSLDYDKFCENNKTNERRRAISLFYVNLMKQGVVDSDAILDLISGLQETLQTKIKEVNQKNIVDEMAEILFILITNTATRYVAKKGAINDENDTWNQIKARVKALSLLRLKDYASLTNKTIFKHIDMCDKF